MSGVSKSVRSKSGERRDDLSSSARRRTFLRRTAAVCGVAVVGGLAGCLDDGTAFDPNGTDTREPTDDGEPTTAGQSTDDDEPNGDALDLRAGMEIGTVFTVAGGQPTRSSVDPDEPGGGRLTTVDAVESGKEVTVSWRQTVERKVTPSATPDPGVGTPTPTPETEIVEESGTITATGLATAHEPFLPMYWEPGETTTETSAMWLSREAYRELEETRETAWSADVLTRVSWVGKSAQERIRDGVKEVDDVTLAAEATYVDFELSVGGRSTTVRAIEAHDSFGNEYVILANAANPLVVKFTYDAVSVGFTGFDTALWSLIKAVFSGYQVLAIESP